MSHYEAATVHECQTGVQLLGRTKESTFAGGRERCLKLQRKHDLSNKLTEQITKGFFSFFFRRVYYDCSPGNVGTFCFTRPHIRHRWERSPVVTLEDGRIMLSETYNIISALLSKALQIMSH